MISILSLASEATAKTTSSSMVSSFLAQPKSRQLVAKLLTQGQGDRFAVPVPVILDILKADKVEAIISVSASVYKIDDTKFSYNKDSDQWFCEMGNCTIKKVYQKTKKTNDIFRYTFDKKQCQNCIK